MPAAVHEHEHAPEEEEEEEEEKRKSSLVHIPNLRKKIRPIARMEGRGGEWSKGRNGWESAVSQTEYHFVAL